MTRCESVSDGSSVSSTKDPIYGGLRSSLRTRSISAASIAYRISHQFSRLSSKLIVDRVASVGSPSLSFARILRAVPMVRVSMLGLSLLGTASTERQVSMIVRVSRCSEAMGSPNSEVCWAGKMCFEGNGSTHLQRSISSNLSQVSHTSRTLLFLTTARL